MRSNDTIAAISTSLSPAGIGIVRMSGSEAVSIADKIYQGKKSLKDVPTHTINYGHVIDKGEPVDQVLVMVMKAPRTYTGEDTVEIDCHGGLLVQKKILELLLDNGACLAQPGEFTKRAFLNGKMDLSQAEAVADIIEAGNAAALKVGMNQLSGRLSEEIRYLREILLNEIAFIEAALDDPEHYSLDEYSPVLRERIGEIRGRINKLIDDADTGIMIKAGISTVILGRPNAGKSSVFNLLTRSDSAIVTDIAGTTRDTLTGHISFSGISLNITDTAGLRESDDTVEKIGVQRAKKAAENADLILCIIDGSEELTDEDRSILEFVKDKKVIILLNKSDLDSKISSESLNSAFRVIEFSAKSGKGTDALEEEIRHLFFKGELNVNDEIYVTEVRHLQALKDAEKSLDLVLEGLDSFLSEDLLSVDMADAYEALGSIVGEAVDEDIINRIFEKFCMGK